LWWQWPDVATLCVYRPGDARADGKVQAQLLTQSLNMIDAFNESLKITTRQFEKVLLGKSVAHSPQPGQPHRCGGTATPALVLGSTPVNGNNDIVDRFLQDR
jgi:methyl-accepting chemotaxis protein-2 (aspartate sensor receptor)